MKNQDKIIILVLVTLTLTISSCTVIGDIFKAGVWVGILLVVAVVGIIIFIMSKIGKK